MSISSYLNTTSEVGHIQGLNRMGADEAALSSFGQWDNLVYAYNGNQLTKVTDLATGAHKDFGFKDGLNTGDDYLYDVNGNMTQDLNKGIFDIKYNHLNLPVEINFDEYSTIPSIRYKYDATGVKL